MSNTNDNNGGADLGSLLAGAKSFVNLCKAAACCPLCASTDRTFRDALSLKESTLSGFCQKCQDKVFADDGED